MQAAVMLSVLQGNKISLSQSIPADSTKVTWDWLAQGSRIKDTSWESIATLIGMAKWFGQSTEKYQFKQDSLHL